MLRNASCAVFLLSLSLVSCGGGISSSASGESCNGQQGTTCQSLSISGVTRTYLLHVPPNFQKNSSALVIVLHGSGGNGLGMEVGTGFSNLADQVGFAVAYPDGLFDSISGQTNWAYFFKDFTDDVGFLRQLINTVQANIEPDPRKIYVTGLSSGALMSQRLGVQLSDLVAAIGAVEGGLFINAPANTAVVPAAVATTSVVILHGDLDQTVPYCGNPSDASQELTFNYWSGALGDGCSNVDTGTPLCDSQGNITAIYEKSASNCKGNTEVKFYKLLGGIHTWYTVPMNVMGQIPFNPDFNPTTGVTTTNILWNFLAAHPKP